MNDFTKEELEDFLAWGEVYTEFGSSWVDKVHRPLINKIQSMIENYCDHEWEPLGFGNNSKCKKCGKIE